MAIYLSLHYVPRFFWVFSRSIHCRGINPTDFWIVYSWGVSFLVPFHYVHSVAQTSWKALQTRGNALVLSSVYTKRHNYALFRSFWYNQRTFFVGGTWELGPETSRDRFWHYILANDALGNFFVWPAVLNTDTVTWYFNVTDCKLT